MSSAHRTDNPLRRREPRTEAREAEIHGIVSGTRRAQGPFVVWDLSDNGLKLWVPDRADVGEIIKLTVGKPFVLLLNAEVRWCKAARDGSGFMVGVRALDNLGGLEALNQSVAQAIMDRSLPRD